MSIPIPPDNRAVGTGNPPVDFDQLDDVVAQLAGRAPGSTLSSAARIVRTATVVVAASNATAADLAAADYVCTGTSGTGGDEVTIQQAIQRAAQAAPGAGRVILAAGTYWRTNPVYLDKTGMALEGQGDSTKISVAAGAAGYASVIIGSNGAYDGVSYLPGDSAPASPPAETVVRNLLIQDYASPGTALAGSNHGLVNRGGTNWTEKVSVKCVALDGYRHEGFRQMGASGTLGAAVVTTPVWGTPESWTVNGIGSPPATPFLALIGGAGAQDYDPEIVNVTAAAGTAWTVQRGWLATTVKTHASGASVTVMAVTTVYQQTARDAYVWTALRDGISVQQGIDDSEWHNCLVTGGTSPGAKYTRYGFWFGGSGCRFIDCHPFLCTTYGFYGFAQAGGSVTVSIVSGEYETNGAAGIYLQQGTSCEITGGVSMYGNATYDVFCSYVTGFVLADSWMSSACFRHLTLYNTTQANVHDNHLYGLNSGVMLEIQGIPATAGPVNSQVSVHDNTFQASGSGFGYAAELNACQGVNLHDNVFEEGVEETSGADWNIIQRNTFTNPSKGLTVTGAHTKAYDNTGISDLIYSAAPAVSALAGKFYQLDGTGNTVTVSPPGAGAGAIALAAGSVGVSLPAASITLASAPGAAFPAQGQALVPVTGGYAVVSYVSVSGAILSQCSGGSGTTVAGNVYVMPDASLKFRAYASNTTSQVSIAVPAGLTVNGGSSAFMLARGTVYDVTFAPAAPGWFAAPEAGQSYAGVFGTGSDGAATLDGTVTAAWASKSGSTYTMTRDAQLTALTINNGVTLKPASFRIFCTGTVTNNGTITAAGNAAAGSAAGVAIGSGSLGGGRPGGAGGTGVSGAGASGSNANLGNAGGAGGAGTSGAAGAGGTTTQSLAVAQNNLLVTPYAAITGIFAYQLTNLSVGFGAGGGGGGSDASSNAGGGGGGGGGVVAILANALVNAGSITAQGGAGAAGTGGNAGGGGGGSGGLIAIYTRWAVTGAGTTTITGGTLGAGSGSGSAGSNGGTGLLVQTVII